MKAKSPAPEIILRGGKPVAVILGERDITRLALLLTVREFTGKLVRLFIEADESQVAHG